MHPATGALNYDVVPGAGQGGTGPGVPTQILLVGSFSTSSMKCG